MPVTRIPKPTRAHSDAELERQYFGDLGWQTVEATSNGGSQTEVFDRAPSNGTGGHFTISTPDDASGGTFTLVCFGEETDLIAWDADDGVFKSNMLAALNALPSSNGLFFFD